MLFPFLTIILGAVSLGVTTQKPGIFLIPEPIVGIILGRTPVAVFMTVRKQVKSTCCFRVLGAHIGLTNPTAYLNKSMMQRCRFWIMTQGMFRRGNHDAM